MDDLLKDAIADAKAVRETALENAKIALEEAFTPRLQSMLSKKIQSEIEDEEDENPFADDEEEDAEEGYHWKEDDEDPSDEFSDEFKFSHGEILFPLIVLGFRLFVSFSISSKSMVII